MNRRDFPILHESMNGKPLVYLDNAATTQKPAAVLHAMDEYYRTVNANVHRAAHGLADEATRAYESARDSARCFLNAAHREEIICVECAIIKELFRIRKCFLMME